MLVASKDLTSEAKVMIYPGSRKFFANEMPVLREQLDSFCSNLEGIDICCKIEYDRFLIFMISEATALDLDKQNLLVDFVLSLEKKFEITLLDKVNVCFKQGQYVQLKEIPAFKLLIKNKGVSKKTVVFDNMINTKFEYDESWEVPAGESWLSHFF
ncbi:ABC transporter ATPase [Lutimonas halocynthiae]|uniref:ABC transporter ATPase n=1 Tax=Lutimonas halocynthiae TaxID=1446477 RepID=UPI0025B58012|nr:ABC transporter ATPase [Lutimonas halocynthiae]MDN3641962.1 ABC transporter ATPase [Lutimonas halocynthiae]